MTMMPAYSYRFQSRCIVLLTVFICGLLALIAPQSAFARQGARTPVVTWAASLDRTTARAGETVPVKVTATVQSGYHIYSIVPVENGPQATEITVAGDGVQSVGKVIEPQPKIVDDKNFGMKIGMHEGTPAFVQNVEVARTAKPGSISLTASVFYMACNDSSCLPPKMVKVPVPALTIEAGEARKEFAGTAPAPSAPTAGTTQGPSASPIAGSGQNEGLGTFLLTAFGAGLLALVTPCVFPLIPVTLAFFTKQATQKNSEDKAVQTGVVKLAAIYSLGIVIAFTAIGAILAGTVGAAGANRVASNPWVNLGFGVLFIVFALSLLEVIEIQPPAFLRKLTPQGKQANGTLGVLGMGLTFVVAAFTCTAPFIGTVLVAAASAQSGAQWIRPILGMTTFATALALPFFVLALFPSLLARLPKSGAWLSTVKGAMGWLELAAAVKFLSGADQVFQWKLLNQSTMLGLWAIAFLGGAFWLLGVLRIGYGAPDAPATPARASWAALFAAVGVYCLYGLTGRPMDSFTVAYLPPSDYGYGATKSSSELEYLDSLEAGIAQAKAENKPIFIDFTGWTCTNCRAMERNVFPKAPVKAELEKFVRVRLYTDNRKNGEELQAYQEKTFGTIALPLYAVLDSTGKPVVSPVGKTDEPEKFAAFLRSGRESAQSQAVAKN